MIAENNDLNVNNNSCELVPEVQVTDDRREVLDIKDKVREVSNGFNSEVSGSLRPNGHKVLELREWEKNILVHLNNVNLIERDDRKNVKFKLFKHDIYGLALVDTGNLVKGTLVQVNSGR